MPVFRVKSGTVQQLPAHAGFPKLEKGLQSFVETNLERLFKIRFVGTEVTTGAKHRGRIDTLGLDEDDSPVIIEYKQLETENVINQGLFYLDWLYDHRGDFEKLVHSRLGVGTKVAWSAPRLILLAQSYNRYDHLRGKSHVGPNRTVDVCAARRRDLCPIAHECGR